MKKCLSLLLAALMLAAVLTGCGGNPSTEETDAPADTGTEQAAVLYLNPAFGLADTAVDPCAVGRAFVPEV